MSEPNPAPILRRINSYYSQPSGFVDFTLEPEAVGVINVTLAWKTEGSTFQTVSIQIQTSDLIETLDNLKRDLKKLSRDQQKADATPS